MNPRERWLATLLFKEPDKVPFRREDIRIATRERWYTEGLPKDVNDIVEYAYRQAGGCDNWPTKHDMTFVVNERMMPAFEEKVIEKGPRSQIVQDWKGNICEIGNEFTVEHLRGGFDLVTRRWIKCPVESRGDWENMKKRYDPDESSRLPENAKQLGTELAGRDWPIEIQFSGPFWQLREWLGFENLCMMLHDDPLFVEEMLHFWSDYVAALLERVFECFIPDSIYISEDMAYKGFSMISPDMVRKFLFGIWKRWGKIIHKAGVPVYAMDSDGFIGELIPIWIEAGINVCDPIEVAAGNDIVAFRKQFGRQMAYRAGVDKRCIAAGGKTIENEIRRLEPVILDGGFIPGCDHGVPHDISWKDFVCYIKLLSQANGWL